MLLNDQVIHLNHNKNILSSVLKTAESRILWKNHLIWETIGSKLAKNWHCHLKITLDSLWIILFSNKYSIPFDTISVYEYLLVATY